MKKDLKTRERERERNKNMMLDNDAATASCDKYNIMHKTAKQHG